MQQTLVIIKPDAVQRQWVGRIISRFEDKGLKIVGLKMLRVTLGQAQRMYAEHEGKDFHPRLVTFMTSSPVVAAVLEGKEAVAVARKMIGPTFGPDAPGGTIRGDFGMSRRFNIVHGSDSAQAAEREIGVFFQPGELLEYSRPNDAWVYDMNGPEAI